VLWILLFRTAVRYCGSAIAASMPIINTTTRSSINVKAEFFGKDFFKTKNLLVSVLPLAVDIAA
jgi:hypothetical protein